MTNIQFRGSGGLQITAEITGSADDPAVLLIQSPGDAGAIWSEVSPALVSAGRRVVSIVMRGDGGAPAAAFAAMVDDLRAVLAQMGSRPVVVAAGPVGWIAAEALAVDAALLAAGLVLVDLPADAPAGFAAAAAAIAIPALIVQGAFTGAADPLTPLAAQFPDCEAVEVVEADLAMVEDRTDAFNALLLDFLERKQPRAAAEFHAGSDPRTLRDALGCFATGVTIVTARTADGTPIGLTANSFTSVSLDPPLLLVCIANGAGSAPALREAAHFAVNVLQIGQQPASNRFAGKGEDRFAQTPWEEGVAGVPVLTGSLGTFECRRSALHEEGDHFILIGEVQRARFEPRRDPLLYFRGKYRRLHFA